MNRDSSRASLRWYVLDKQLESRLSPRCPRDQLPVDLGGRSRRAPTRLQRLCATDTRTLK